MRPASALKLTMQQRLGFEIMLAQARIERAYKQMQDDLRAHGKYTDAAGIALHEAEQVLCALERVSGVYYQRIIDGIKSYNEEQKRHAEEDARLALEVASAPTTSSAEPKA